MFCSIGKRNCNSSDIKCSSKPREQQLQTECHQLARLSTSALTVAIKKDFPVPPTQLPNMSYVITNILLVHDPFDEVNAFLYCHKQVFDQHLA